MHTIVQQDSYFTTMHDWLVTWPPFCITTYVKGGQVTKPIMHGCEIASYPVELLCACLLSKRIYNKKLHCTQTSWPYLISELLVADLFTMLFLLGLAIFLHPRCFCLALYISVIFTSYIIFASTVQKLASMNNIIHKVAIYMTYVDIASMHVYIVVQQSQ